VGSLWDTDGDRVWDGMGDSFGGGGDGVSTTSLVYVTNDGSVSHWVWSVSKYELMIGKIPNRWGDIDRKHVSRRLSLKRLEIETTPLLRMPISKFSRETLIADCKRNAQAVVCSCCTKCF